MTGSSGAGIGEGICIFVEPCGLAEIIGLGIGTVAVVFGPQIVQGTKTTVQQIGMEAECAAEWATARAYCAELYSQTPASRPPGVWGAVITSV